MITVFKVVAICYLACLGEGVKRDAQKDRTREVSATLADLQEAMEAKMNDLQHFVGRVENGTKKGIKSRAPHTVLTPLL